MRNLSRKLSLFTAIILTACAASPTASALNGDTSVPLASQSLASKPSAGPTLQAYPSPDGTMLGTYPAPAETLPTAPVAYPSPAATTPTAPATSSSLIQTSQPNTTTLNQILDFSFIDAQHGWLLGALCMSKCELALRRTVDGGQSWQETAAPLTGISWGSQQTLTDTVNSITFLNTKTGWAFNPGLWATSDGGQTWVNVKPGAAIVEMQVYGDSVWAVKSICDQAGGASCRLSLISLSGQGGGWQPLANLPQMDSPQIQLLRIDKQEAFMLGWRMGVQGVASALLATSDGGITWNKLTAPFEGMCPGVARISAPDSMHLFAACGGQPATAQQQKYLSVSNDGGFTWVRKPDPPLNGYLDDFFAVSPERVFMAIGRGTLEVSNDAGQTWKPAIDLAIANNWDSSGWRIKFIDPNVGWVSLKQIFRTDDGGQTWKLGG